MKGKILIILKGIAILFFGIFAIAGISSILENGLDIANIILLAIVLSIILLLIKSLKSNIDFYSSAEYKENREKRKNEIALKKEQERKAKIEKQLENEKIREEKRKQKELLAEQKQLEKERAREEKRLQKEEQARIKAQEEKEKMDNLISMCQNETDPINKLYIIRDSKIYPYYSHADKAIRKVDNVDLRLKNANLLMQSNLLTIDDINMLTPIFRQAYSTYLQIRREKEEARKQREEQKAQMKYEKAMSKPKTAYKENKKRGIVSCPKCGSTSITTTNKKLSTKRGVAGAVIGGALTGGIGAGVGAVAGGLSSKKMYNVCMNCGHRWKPGK